MELILRLKNSMNTIRPVKRFDSIGSHRASTEFLGSVRQRVDSRSSSGSSNSNGSIKSSFPIPNPSSPQSNDVILGRALVNEVVGPVLDKVTMGEKDLSPEEIEALSMIRKGFEDLGRYNPALAWNTMSDLLSGVNE